MENQEYRILTLEEAIKSSITPSNARFILENVLSKKNRIEQYERLEHKFFDILENVVNASNTTINLIRQYKTLNYSIDSVIIEKYENYGEYDIDKEFIDVITCIEFDEKHHNSHINEDILRQSKIIKELHSKYDLVKFYRVKDLDMYEFLLYAIPYYGNIESSYTYDKLSKFIYYNSIDNKETIEELINEMRRMWEIKWGVK